MARYKKWVRAEMVVPSYFATNSLRTMSTTLNSKELTLVYDSNTSEGRKALAFAYSLAPKVNKQDVEPSEPVEHLRPPSGETIEAAPEGPAEPRASVLSRNTPWP